MSAVLAGEGEDVLRYLGVPSGVSLGLGPVPETSRPGPGTLQKAFHARARARARVQTFSVTTSPRLWQRRQPLRGKYAVGRLFRIRPGGRSAEPATLAAAPEAPVSEFETVAVVIDGCGAPEPSTRRTSPGREDAEGGGDARRARGT